jgi:hypothetical protein
MPAPRATNHSSRTRTRFDWGYRDGWLSAIEKTKADAERLKDRVYKAGWMAGVQAATGGPKKHDPSTAWENFIDKN